MHSGITFGMNAVIVSGFDCALRVGQPGGGKLRLRLTGFNCRAAAAREAE